MSTYESGNNYSQNPPPLLEGFPIGWSFFKNNLALKKCTNEQISVCIPHQRNISFALKWTDSVFCHCARLIVWSYTCQVRITIWVSISEKKLKKMDKPYLIWRWYALNWSGSCKSGLCTYVNETGETGGIMEDLGKGASRPSWSSLIWGVWKGCPKGMHCYQDCMYALHSYLDRKAFQVFV